MGLRSSREETARVPIMRHTSFQDQLIKLITKSSILRTLVSKQRRRMLVGGYNLDMSYITDRLLAMSFPAERMRAFYRNPMWQVKSVLDMRHLGHYKVYNLCIEESYDPEHFHGRVERFPFDDNHVPPIEMIKQFCESVHAWLSSDPKNIAVIHCMAGKGRTGLMVCAYLVYSGMTAEEALQLYGYKRTTNDEGVSIPSQRRYVGYWASILTIPRGIQTGCMDVKLPKSVSRQLLRIRLYDTVNINSVFFVASELHEIPGQMYRPPVNIWKGRCRQIKGTSQSTSSSPRYYYSFIESDEVNIHEPENPHVVLQMDTESTILYHKTCLEYCFEKPVFVSGDVRVSFYQKMIGSRLFYCCFNTAFIKNGLLQFTLRDLDKVGSQARSCCGPAFCMELQFGPANPKNLGDEVIDCCGDDSIV